MIEEVTREGADRWTIRLFAPPVDKLRRFVEANPGNLVQWNMAIDGFRITVILDIHYVYANMREAEDRLAKALEKIYGRYATSPEARMFTGEFIYRFRQEVVSRYEREIPVATINPQALTYHTTSTTNSFTNSLYWTGATTTTGVMPPPKPKTALDWLKAQVDEVCAVGRKELAAT